MEPDRGYLHATAALIDSRRPPRPPVHLRPLKLRRVPPWLVHMWVEPLERVLAQRRPSDFGLSRPEVLAEVRRLHESGWAAWEIECTLAYPPEDPT